jgi:hypothetical protein
MIWRKVFENFWSVRKVLLERMLGPPPMAIPSLATVLRRRLEDLIAKSQTRMTNILAPQTMGSSSRLWSCTMCFFPWILLQDGLWSFASVKRIGCTTRASIIVEVFVN